MTESMHQGNIADWICHGKINEEAVNGILITYL